MNEINTLTPSLLSNVVPKNKLRELQKSVLNDIADTLRNTYGPKGTNTWIIQGNDKASISSKFTKDGRSVLKKILYTDPIAMALQEQVEEIALYADKSVGDGTTSAILLSNAIFNRFYENEDKFESSPQQIINTFKEVSKDINDRIIKRAKEVTVDDIYNIVLTSTNHNESIANEITNIYKTYGMNVFIDVLSSNDTDNKIKILDGLTVDEGYSDPAYINTKEGSCVIPNARVYHFEDPIDTPEMIAFLEKIISDNIVDKVNNKEECIPTVIVSPKITADASPFIKQIITFLQSFDKNNMTTDKPPLLLVTNIGFHSAKMDDIANLCGCKTIRKYIDPKIQAADIEKGQAPTIDTISEFYGKCELVSSDIGNTKFINPYAMHERDEDGFIKTNEDGSFVYSAIYKSMMNYLESELDNAKKNNEDDAIIGSIRKRLRSLQSSMVEYYVGGISMSDREADKALVIDAVKNCRSAVEHGYGRGANLEALSVVNYIFNEDMDNIEKGIANKDKSLIIKTILLSYIDILKDLYVPVYGEEQAMNIIDICIAQDKVYDIYKDEYNNEVITSIYSDIEILNAVSKIVVLLMTTNQCLVQHPNLNRY